MSKYEGYNEKEEFQNKTTGQVMDQFKGKLKYQDQELGELANVAKQGNKLAVNLGDKMEDQNVKLGKLDQEIEVTENKMARARTKFDEFIEKSNFCCLYIFILIEIVALFLIILLV